MAQNEQPDPLEQVFLHAYPNPERIGCPGADVVRALARKELPINHPARMHLGQCSPCFREFKTYQAEWERSKSRRRLVAIMALVAIMSAGSMYIVLRKPWRSDQQRVIVPRPQLPRAGEVASLTLDFTDDVVERSDVPRSSSLGIPKLPRSLVDLSILLPLGSDAGPYEFQFLRVVDNPLISATGRAVRGDRSEDLRLRMGLSAIEPGKYLVAWRTIASQWHYRAVMIDGK